VVRGATGARRDERGAAAGEASDARDAGGPDGFGQGHQRQVGGQPARQHRLPRAGPLQEEETIIRMPESGLPAQWSQQGLWDIFSGRMCGEV
jgi:hypothetical protein